MSLNIVDTLVRRRLLVTVGGSAQNATVLVVSALLERWGLRHCDQHSAHFEWLCTPFLAWYSTEGHHVGSFLRHSILFQWLQACSFPGRRVLRSLFTAHEVSSVSAPGIVVGDCFFISRLLQQAVANLESSVKLLGSASPILLELLQDLFRTSSFPGTSTEAGDELDPELQQRYESIQNQVSNST